MGAIVSTTADGSALNSQLSLPNYSKEPVYAKVAWGSSSSFHDNRSQSGRLWCDHCKKYGYTKETCWKIYRKPADWKPTRYNNSKKNRANNAATERSLSHDQPFYKEQLELLEKLLNQAQPAPSTSIIGTRGIAHRGNHSFALQSKRELDNL